MFMMIVIMMTTMMMHYTCDAGCGDCEYDDGDGGDDGDGYDADCDCDMSTCLCCLRTAHTTLCQLPTHANAYGIAIALKPQRYYNT